MPEKKRIVINTGPLIALIAAAGNLTLLQQQYDEVWVPCEVVKEIEAGGVYGFGCPEFREANWFRK